MTDPTDFIARALFLACIAPASVFVFLYAAYSKWWVTDVGRILMGLVVSLLYIVALSAARALFGEFPGRDILRIVGYTAIFIGLCFMVRALRRIQTAGRRQTRRREREKETV